MTKNDFFVDFNVLTTRLPDPRIVMESTPLAHKESSRRREPPFEGPSRDSILVRSRAMHLASKENVPTVAFICRRHAKGNSPACASNAARSGKYLYIHVNIHIRSYIRTAACVQVGNNVQLPGPKQQNYNQHYVVALAVVLYCQGLPGRALTQCLDAWWLQTARSGFPKSRKFLSPGL